MCYFLYGAVHPGVDEKAYAKLLRHSRFHFAVGTKKEVNRCVSSCGTEFRVTDEMCDCGCAIGSGCPGKKELVEWEQFLISLSQIRGVKSLYLSKNWWNKSNQQERRVHISDIDAVRFLARLKENCLYCIDLYPRYD